MAGVKRPESKCDEDLNTIKIQFEDTIENNENSSHVMNTPNSVDSPNQTPPSSIESGQQERNLAGGLKPRQINNYAKTGYSAVPHVYLAGQIYEQKKKLRMQELERKEREQRQFHAKRAPDFNSIHAARNAKKVVQEHKHTIPTTPKVVHNHRKEMERIQAKVNILISCLQMESKLNFEN